MPQAASAYVGGKMSYTRFIDAVNNNEVARVIVAPDGNSAKLVSYDGNPAEVSLLNDPNLFKLLESKGVDLSIETLNQTNELLGKLAGNVLPLLLIIGLFALFQR